MKRIVFIFTIIIFSNFLSGKIEFAAYPSAGYSNETEFYGGFLAYLRYRPAGFAIKAPKNVFYLSSSYSQKKQFSIFFNPVIHFRNGKYRLENEIQYMKWPSDFFGIGMNTDRNDFENFTAVEKSMRTTFVKKINENWEIGLYFEFMDYDIAKTEVNGLLDSNTIPGSQGSLTSGLGLKLLFDDRNVISFPTRGHLCSFQVNRFSHSIGSDYDFTETILDLRKYFQIGQANTIALQSYFSSISGDVPFNQLNFLNENMRAITYNFYIDKNKFVIRAEDRFFFWQDGFLQRLGLALFAETGEVSAEIDHFNMNDLQFNYGLGFRYSFFLEDRMNVRLDIGFGEVNFNISIGSGEAF